MFARAWHDFPERWRREGKPLRRTPSCLDNVPVGLCFRMVRLAHPAKMPVNVSNVSKIRFLLLRDTPRYGMRNAGW